MDKKTYFLFASTRSEARTYHVECNALDIEYNSPPAQVTAKDKGAAIEAFQKSEIYEQFCEKRPGTCVYTYIRTQGDDFFHRADLLPSI